MTYGEPTARFSDGHEIPLLGFGTWKIAPEDAQAAVEHALEVGYRHLDTATAYKNEAEVGAGIKASGVAREEIFVTTKLPPRLFGQDRQILEESLEKLGVDYLDLWLVHAPGGENYDDPSPEVWRSFIAAQEEGLVRSIGVSNYSLADIDALTEATGVTPVINQIEWTPFIHDPETVAGLAERNIVLEGYSPLRNSNLEDATLLEIAGAHDVDGRPANAADVILSWHLRHGYVVIPRSTRPERIESNAAGSYLQLSDDEVARIDGLAGTWSPES